MHVACWFDPICPWCWNTSRWLVEVAGSRPDMTVEWRSFSLALKNADVDTLGGAPPPRVPPTAASPPPTPVDERSRPPAERSLRMLRVVEAVRAAGRADAIGDLYTELGRRIHHDEDSEFDVGDALEAVGLDRSLADGADDASLEDVVRASMDEALDLAGDDVGVPVVAFDGTGFFGPILVQVPTGGDGGRLRERCDEVLVVPARATERIQEGHITLIHLFCELIERMLFGDLQEAG